MRTIRCGNCHDRRQQCHHLAVFAMENRPIGGRRRPRSPEYSRLAEVLQRCCTADVVDAMCRCKDDSHSRDGGVVAKLGRL